MATKTVDILLNLQKTGNGAEKTVSGLKAIQDQANKTRESMARLTEVGSKMALVGGAIVAPFALAMKKYVDTAKETEPTSRRIVELSKKWEESQVRLGRVTATIVLPALEQGAKILESVISFAEKNPGIVQAALTIGTTLVVLGGLITTTAQLVSTVATIQGLAAAAGLASAGGGAAAELAGVGGGAIVATGIASAVPAIMAGLSAVFLPALLAGMILTVVGPLTLGFFNSLMGTNQTWQDLLVTVQRLPTVLSYLIGNLASNFNTGLINIGKSIGDGLKYVVDAIGAWFQGGKASGGYMSNPGFYAGAENGRRGDVLNGDLTRNAERAIGGQLTQASVNAMLTQNYHVGSGMTRTQAERVLSRNQVNNINGLAGVFR